MGEIRLEFYNEFSFSFKISNSRFVLASVAFWSFEPDFFTTFTINR